MIFVDSDGAALHARMLGDPGRPAIAFSNSLGTDFRIWEHLAGALADRYSILLYDKRGHGLSDLGEGDLTIDRHVDDLVALLDHFGIRRFGLVGLSIGGLIAQRFAVRAPERLAALVLCDTAARIGSAETWDPRIGAVERDGIEPIADAILERWFTPAYRDTQVLPMRGWRNMLVRQPRAGYAANCRAIRDADLTADAGRITTPTLVVVGDQDGATPPALVRATADLIPGARFEVIAGAGHIPCVEQPEALLRLVAHHLAEAGHV